MKANGSALIVINNCLIEPFKDIESFSTNEKTGHGQSKEILMQVNTYVLSGNIHYENVLIS